MSSESSGEKMRDKVTEIKEKIEQADAIVIGAGAGLSTSAGYTYSGDRFNTYFADFKSKYGFTDMYSGGFYPYKTLEEHCHTGAGTFILIDTQMYQNQSTIKYIT